MIDLTSVPQLKQFLQTYGIRLMKDLGQHYLVDRPLLKRICGWAEIEKDDRILETGAGIGTLTQELAELSDFVTAVEFDRQVISPLKVNLGTETKVQVVMEDALRIEVPTGEWKWVANLPYQITGPILKKFMVCGNLPRVAVLMIQKEVAEKICSEKGSMISLLVKNFMEPKICQIVKREQFFPSPNVDSAVIKMTRREQPVIAVEKWLAGEKLLRVAFMNKRKTLRNGLRSLYGEQAEEMLLRAGIEEGRRAEELSLEEWGRLV